MFTFIEYISFLNFNWWFIILGIITWLIVVYLTIGFKSKYIFIKSILWLFAIGSLIFAWLQPQVKKELKASKAILLTTEKAVEQFKEIENTGENTFALSRLKSNSKISKVININHLLHKQPIVSELEIVGNGLTVEELQALHKIPVKFTSISENELSNPIEIKYPETVFTGESYKVLISLANDTLVHSYCENRKDTILIENGEINFFNQFATPCNYLSKINLYNKANELVDVITLPVKVIEKQRANILIVNGYPFFEHQYLKKFIGKQGHQLWVRTQTSIDKYKFDYVNTTQEKKINLTSRFLKQVDLLIIDGAALKSLTKTEYDAINDGRNKGMGVLLRMDEDFESATYNWEALGLGIKRTANSNRDYVSIIKDGKNVEVEIFSFQNKLASTKLIKGEGAGKILSTNRNPYQPFCITTIKNSYLFNLKGDSLIYNWLWENIIDESIPQKLETKNVWRLKNDIANVADEYVEIELITNETEPEAYVKMPSGDWLRLSLKQSYLNSELYESTFWPQQNGWYAFKTTLDTVPQKLYMAAKAENILLRKSKEERWKYTLTKYHDENTKEIGQTIAVNKSIPLFWNWLVFIFSLILIFIIEKFL